MILPGYAGGEQRGVGAIESPIHAESALRKALVILVLATWGRAVSFATWGLAVSFYHPIRPISPFSRSPRP